MRSSTLPSRRAHVPRPISVCLDVPDAARPRAAYAVEELLHGLGLAPAWTDADAAMLYVGTRPEASRTEALRLRLDPASVLELRRADPHTLGWLVHGDRRWPLPVGPTGVHAPGDRPGAAVEADVVGAAFWWLAGVQEAATVARDVHGRFAHDDSLQAHLAVRDQPAVDGIRRWLGDALAARGVGVQTPTWAGCDWAVGLTFDLDGVATRRVPAALADLTRGHVGRALRRGLGPDARWQSVLSLRDLARRHGVAPTVFWKAGAGAREDVPYRLERRRVRHLLHAWAQEGAETGLHPSYHAHDHAERLGQERDRLADVAGRVPTSVRTHFLRWDAGRTPHVLAASGFALDSSLGFATAVGFRRGTARPFRLYDLDTDRVLPLREVPLAVMDTSLYSHLGLNAPAAIARAWDALKAAQSVGGCAVLLWHDDVGHTVPSHVRLDGLDQILRRARADGAFIGSLERLGRPR